MRAGQAPLLGDLLDAAAGRLLVDLELKEDGYVEEAMAVIAQHLPPDSYVVTSFLAGVLAQVKRHRPETRTGLLVAPRAARQAGRRVRETGADFLLPHVSLVRAGIVEWAAGQGLASGCGRSTTPAPCARSTGDPRVAALITDAPAQALRWLVPPSERSHPVDLADSRE